jgi:nitrite reductase/ring-hydroxylating ferredoxin subunit
MGKHYENKRKPQREGKKITVGRVEAVPEGRGATVKLKTGGELALFNVGGRFYAIENFCPHKGAPLADSRLYGNIVECNLHGWRFDVRNGTCFTKKSCSIETYEVVIEDEMIKIIV